MILGISMLPASRVTVRRRSASKSVVAISAVLAVSACGSGEFVTPTAAPSSQAAVTTTTTAGACTNGPSSPAQNADEKYLTAKIAKLQFPAGTCFFMVDTVDMRDQPGMISVTIDLDAAASTSPNDLRPAATDVAHLLKNTEIGSRTAVLDITNQGAAKPKYRTLLTDENFQDHPWDGKSSTESAIWKIVDPN
ncbi:hypothetical protein AB0M22_38355 [Nocardia sp. NPDC051756]|uniref:hypothetical protein n=1 Tax=Nocardia sp. NPDC051756 TaxID=3154751 RepID=UPI0034123303